MTRTTPHRDRSTLEILDGSAKSCDRYAEMQRQSARHQAMLDQINAAFTA